MRDVPGAAGAAPGAEEIITRSLQNKKDQQGQLEEHRLRESTKKKKMREATEHLKPAGAAAPGGAGTGS